MSRLLIGVGCFGIVLSLLWPLIFEVSKEMCPWIKATPDGCPWLQDEGCPNDAVGSSPASRVEVTETGSTLTASVGYPSFTVLELKQFDGSTDERPIYIGIGGKVFDVTEGRSFYGKGMAYNAFAGKAASRALTMWSMEDENMNDDVSDFDEEQWSTLATRVSFFASKYPQVGVVAGWVQAQD